jgi:hypothetical protein
MQALEFLSNITASPDPSLLLSINGAKRTEAFAGSAE